MQVSELAGPALEWALLKARALPVKDRLDIMCKYVGELGYAAWCSNGLGPHTNEHCQFGPDPIVAISRCYIAKMLGDEIDLPAELQQNT